MCASDVLEAEAEQNGVKKHKHAGCDHFPLREKKDKQRVTESVKV